MTTPYKPLNNDHNAPLIDLLRRPTVAWPTIGLFLFSLTLWSVSIFGYYQLWGVEYWYISMILSVIGGYCIFTVVHDATHRAVSKVGWFNDLMGVISMPMFICLFPFRAFRFVHMQHHRFTNLDDKNAKDQDPDVYFAKPGITFLLRWATVDLAYTFYYLKRINTRPLGELMELVMMMTATVGIIGFLMASSNGAFGIKELLILWIIPNRITLVMLAALLGYLPHTHTVDDGEDNAFQATVVRVGYEPLMTGVMLYQNYHLIHHLYPLVPFYRYIQLWNLLEDKMLENNAAIYDWSGKKVSNDEYIDKYKHKINAMDKSQAVEAAT